MVDVKWQIDVMANTVSEIKPAVISSVGPVQANPEGEMDALLLGRTRVSTENKAERTSSVANFHSSLT